MLVLSRRIGERIRIGDGVTVEIVGRRGNKVRLGVSAPREVCVLREELIDVAIPGESDGDDTSAAHEAR